MVVQHPAHLAGGGEGAARHDGAAAGQPPARLPDVRQGRRVPAAEPGHVHRPGRDPVRRHQAHLPQADRAVRPGAAGPRALHAVRPVHPVRRRRSPATRSSSCSTAARTSRSASPRACRSTPTSPATPCRSARSARSPARPTGSGPGRSTWCPRPASASTARPAAGSAPTTAAARSPGGWPATSPRSTRSGTATRAGGPSPTPPSPTGWSRRWSATRPGCCSRPPGRRPWRSRPRGLLAARGRAGVLPGGRLTLEDAYAYAKFARVALATNDIDMRARPHSAEELAVPRPTTWPGAVERHLRRARAGAGGAAGRLRARGRVARSCSCGCARRSGPAA